MNIISDAYQPYEYENKYECLRHVESRCHSIKRSLKFIEKNNEHLCVRCPLSGDYLYIEGTVEEIDWLHNELTNRKWYR